MAGMPVVGVFLSNIFLAIFDFLIANTVAAIGMSDKLYLPIFAFSFVKISMPRY